jgi:hypothetical protein
VGAERCISVKNKYRYSKPISVAFLREWGRTDGRGTREAARAPNRSASMGAGASTSLPEFVDKQQAAAFAGDRFNEAAFDAAAVDGRVPRAALIAAGNAGDRIDPHRACDYWWLDADRLRALTPDELQRGLPDFRTLRAGSQSYGDLGLMKQSITPAAACRHKLRNRLVCSHRWEKETNPDPTGQQLREVVAYLKRNPVIQDVWIDFPCMPQSPRSEDEDTHFKEMLEYIGWAFLACSVLIIFDADYNSRFWTRYEAFLAMQMCEPKLGLTSAVGHGDARFEVVCLGSTKDYGQQYLEMLMDFGRASAERTLETLSNCDIKVTNEKDKTMQLEKLKRRNQHVIQVLETAEHPPPSACALLIIGECGDGKSTLVNALRDPARSEEAKAGLATRGVTKDIRVFEGKPIKGRAIQIMDTPGIGDQDVTPLSLVAMIEAKLSDHPIPISGVIVTTPATEGRIKLGAQVVQTLVEHGFVGEHKWDSIILVGTKSDRADEDEKAFFRDHVVKDFFEKAPPGTSPKFALTTKQDVSQLVTQIGSLPGVPIEYVQPETASLAQILAAKFGIPVEAFNIAFDQMRNQLASEAMAEMEKERRQIEQLLQEQAKVEAKAKAEAAEILAKVEAKAKAEAAEMARKFAALEEQLKQSSDSSKTAALAQAQEQARQANAAALAQAQEQARQAKAAAAAEAAELARQRAALQEQLERREERYVRARPTPIADGVTYIPRLGARAIRWLFADFRWP